MHVNAKPADPSTGVDDPAVEDLVDERQLIIVSNRQPYQHNYDDDDQLIVNRPTGGLTESLDPIMQRTSGTWIAWGDGDGDFDVVDLDGCVDVPPDNPGYQLQRLWLSDEQIKNYYYGFSNQVLWPISHSALTLAHCDPGFWEHYRAVNEEFADAVANHADDQSIVWFHDYHLALAPKFARRSLSPDALMLYFWHIPWPSWDTFRACPHGRELLEGLLQSDFLGFHTPRYQTNFLRCVNAALDDPAIDWETGNVITGDRQTTVGAIPMGVPVGRIERTMATNPTNAFWSTFAEKHGITDEMQIGIGVERLDYTKGIVNRLQALERLWECNPQWRESFTYIQNGSESRSHIPAYQEVQEAVSTTVTRINDRFSTDEWTPIIYTTERLSQSELYDLYRNADLAIVTPIRDGMNLVAQEYIATQRDNDGVLVLSDQAGVHDELGAHTVTVRPSDIEHFATKLTDALTMPPGKRRHYMNHLRRWVIANDLDTWLTTNLQAAMGASPTDPSTDTRSLPAT